MTSPQPALAQRWREAFVWACELDVAARKPGNVSAASPGHGMDAAHFVASARAAAHPLCEPGAPVGRRIEAAVEATWAVVQCNTNLGIVLLCAPLAAAAERWAPTRGEAGLRASLAAVLRSLDVDDARAAYRAIARAHPAGLGRVAQQDVHAEPTLDLRAAMALAAERDLVARQYVTDFADVFAVGVATFRAALARTADPVAALQRTYLEFLAAQPDSHIVRKHGAAAAQCVMREALAWRKRARAGERVDADPAFAAWDESLKRRALNPGTCADLCVASAMAAAIVDDAAQLRVNP
ncbi:triphosphoribosyl-dephospho-CoA synthase [Azohydromonas sediminis]|uniref:triphosphoribosyl-dephospho-CoA synthase n=1 Tax=Azohydromonas sediminis TaxID=2259674 RepID=UPI000E65B287